MKINHGDIQPSNILVTESGETKLIDAMCFTEFNTGFKRMLVNNTYFSPLSPKLMMGYKTRQSDVMQDQEKSDIFSLGITMLCAATNQHFSSFYDFNRAEIRFEMIYSQVQKLQSQGYSRLFVGCLSNILNQNEFERPSTQEVFNFINMNSEGRR